LFDDKKKNTMVDMDAIIKSSKQFIENRQTGLLGIYFNLVRLGAFYPNGTPCDGDGDGTIVAMAANNQESKKNFLFLGEDLASNLMNQFP
jgi:hypothetical protein